MSKREQIYKALKSQLSNGKAFTDDIALDDMAGAAEELAVPIQRVINTYNLNREQLLLVLSTVAATSTLDDRLYAAMEGELDSSALTGSARVIDVN